MESKDVIMGMEKEYAITGMTPEGSCVSEKDLRHVAEMMATLDSRIPYNKAPEFDNPMGARIYIDSTNSEAINSCHRFEIATPECPNARTLATPRKSSSKLPGAAVKRSWSSASCP